MLSAIIAASGLISSAAVSVVSSMKQSSDNQETAEKVDKVAETAKEDTKGVVQSLAPAMASMADSVQTVTERIDKTETQVNAPVVDAVGSMAKVSGKIADDLASFKSQMAALDAERAAASESAAAQTSADVQRLDIARADLQSAQSLAQSNVDRLVQDIAIVQQAQETIEQNAVNKSDLSGVRANMDAVRDELTGQVQDLKTTLNTLETQRSEIAAAQAEKEAAQREADQAREDTLVAQAAKAVKLAQIASRNATNVRKDALDAATETRLESEKAMADLRDDLVKKIDSVATMASTPKSTGYASLNEAFVNRQIQFGPGTRVLDCEGGVCSSGTKTRIMDNTGAAGQTWSYNPSKQSVTSGGFCLDVANSGTSDGTPVRSWSCNDSNAQKWEWQGNVGPGKGRVQLRNPQSGKCLDVTGAVDQNGRLTQLWECAKSGHAWDVIDPAQAAAARQAAQKAQIAALKEGQAVKCSAANPIPGGIFRWEGNALRHYPNPAIASSWDPNWGSAQAIDCTGLKLELPMASKPPAPTPTLESYITKSQGDRIQGDIEPPSNRALTDCAARCDALGSTCIGFSHNAQINMCYPKKADGLSPSYAQNGYQFYDKKI